MATGSLRRALLVTLVVACWGCHRRPAIERVPDDDDDDGGAIAAMPYVPPDAEVSRCIVASPTWLVPPLGAPDAGEPAFPDIEAGPALARSNALAVAWLDNVARRVVSGRASAPLAPGETAEPPVIAPLGDATLVATTVARGRTASAHRVFVATGSTLATMFEQTEGLRDEPSLAFAGNARGALLAWSVDRPAAGGHVLVQAIDRPVPSRPPPVHAVTAERDDATDPRLFALDDMSYILTYLLVRELDADDDGHRVATEIVAQKLAVDGRVVGPPVHLTPGSARRFGVELLVDTGAVWLAYRVTSDRDPDAVDEHATVAVVRFRPDLTREFNPVYLSDEGADVAGAPTLVARDGGVAVFWSERRGGALVTRMRRVAHDGRDDTATSESALHGMLPVTTRGTPFVLMRGPRGEPGIAAVTCR